MWIAYSSYSPLHWQRNHWNLQPHSKFLFAWLQVGIHPQPLLTFSNSSITENNFAKKGNEIINDSQLIRLCYNNVHASRLSTKHSKPGAKNQMLIKHMQKKSHSWPNKKNTISAISQHLEQQVTAPAWLIALYMTKCKNSSIKWDPSISLHMKRYHAMTKTVLPSSPQQQVLMQSLWKALKQCSIKCFKIAIKNQTIETTVNPHWLQKDTIRIVYPHTYCWSHGITSILRHNSKYWKLQKEGLKSNATYQNQIGGFTKPFKV